jgi:magnesium transporter
MKRKNNIFQVIGINKLIPKTNKPATAPGTIRYFGKKQEAQVELYLMDYNESEMVEKKIGSLKELVDYEGKPSITWVNITGVHNEGIIKELGEYVGVHPLVMEDMVNTTQSPKVEEFDDYLFVILKMASYDEEQQEVVMEQLSMILGVDYVILLQENKAEILDGLRERIRQSRGKFRKLGSDYLLYAIIDAIVDHYFNVLERLGEDIEKMEEDLVSSPDKNLLLNIYRLKKELAFLRKSIWPMREVAGNLYRMEHKLVQDGTKVFLRDVYDHTIQVVETVETFRDMASGMLDLYLSTTSNKMNAIMKVLTIFAAIFIPLTFLAGVYGMNFEFMPELHYKLAYPIWWGVTIVLGVGLLIYFVRKKWL